MTDEQATVEGLISVRAVLAGRSREIHSILIGRNRWERDVAELERAAQTAGVRVEHVSQAEIEAHAGGKSHGGIIAFVGPRRYVDIHDLTKDVACPSVVMLDGIEDPFNFGYAVRALYAAGVDGLVVRPRNWTSAAGVVARASAGASELLPIAVAETASDAAAVLRAQGLTVACTTHKRSVSIYSADLTVPLFLVIGGEKRGITRSFLDKADLLLHIPYGRAFDQSLGMAAAAAILSFEIMRQRRHAK